jgi:RND family efflux transporter MFP subunit
MSNTEIDLNQASQNNSEQRPQIESQPLSRSLFVGLAAAALLLGVVIYSGIHQSAMAASNLGAATERAAIAAVNVVEPKSGTDLQELVLPGTTQAFIDTPIFARTSGYLKQWYFDIGAHVEQGQLLAVIETPELDQQLAQAQANLKTAQANEKLAEITAARWQNLLKTDSVSKQETDQAVQDLSAKQATVESMTADVQRLEQLQSYEKVYAPFSGVITARNTDIGALINAGSGGSQGQATVPQELFHMASVNRLRIFVSVPEVDSAAAQNGAKAPLTLDEFPGETFQGMIARNSDAIDLNSRTLNVEVDIDNRGGRIKPGAYVFVHLKLPENSKKATSSLTIPANTLLFRSEGLRVGVVRGDHAELVPITIGRDYGSTVEVVSGLRPDDQIIVNPSDSLTTGTPVRIAEQTAGVSK